MEGAHLEGADLWGSHFDSNTCWRGAIYDEGTRWPGGFDPEVEGCLMAERDGNK